MLFLSPPSVENKIKDSVKNFYTFGERVRKDYKAVVSQAMSRPYPSPAHCDNPPAKLFPCALSFKGST
jgi:hypothetical protein